MNLLKAVGTIGGLTMVSRVAGFARDMVGSRILGASHANDAFTAAFLLPNIFRRLFGEGAFASGFVPLFSRRLAGGGPADAEQFANEILAVFMPALLAVTLVFEIVMPGFVWLIYSDYGAVPGKLELTTELTRYMFPYLVLISLVALLSGVLNSLTRFAVAAFAPALLNIALIAALLLAPDDSGTGIRDSDVVRAMAAAVIVGGVLQFALCWWAVRKAGVRMRFGRPRLTPAVKELVVLILPATLAAGVYQISQLFYGYFASRLGEGALTNLGYADRLSQLPLSIIGTALGTAILPSISRAIERREDAAAADIQARAFDLAMLLTLPATLALSVTAFPIIAALFQGGEYTIEAARVTGNILAILATGLPAYVLVKVLTPGFYARKDVKTPVRIAIAVLVASVGANFALIPQLGIYSLAAVTSGGAWLNFVLLFIVLAVRGHFRMPGWLVSRVARQLIAAAVMAAVLIVLSRALGDVFTGSAGERILGLGLIVATGGAIYFGLAWLIGGIDKRDIATLFRRAKSEEAPLEEGDVSMRIVSGIQPTGNLHLGNYLGAIRNWVRMQDKAAATGGLALFFLADLHSLSEHLPRETRVASVLDMTAALLACGISVERAVLFNQAAVPAHAELCWLLNGTARMGWLNRMTQWKDKAGKNREGASVALFDYPVLQAADVLLYQATHVPVGDDQKQHLELARDIAAKFNTDTGTELFTLPEPFIPPVAARIMSLRDGTAKMSKSDPSDMSRINLADDADTIAQKIRKAKTDPEPLPATLTELEGRPEALNLVTIFAALEDVPVEAVLQRFEGQGFGTFKPALAERLVETLRPISTRYRALRDDVAALDQTLATGAERARALAEPTLRGAYLALGLRHAAN